MRTGRRSLIVVALSAVLAGEGLAQDRAIEVGIVGGLNHNTMTGVGPVDSRLAGQVGLYGNFQLSRHVAFRPEAAVSWKRVGTDQPIQFPPPCDPGPCPLTYPVPGYDLQETTSLTWLEVPLLAQVSLGAVGGQVIPRLLAGPYVAIRLGCSVSGSSAIIYDRPAGIEPPGPGVTYSQSCADATGQTFGNGDAGFVLGGSVGINRFGIGLRWTRSMVTTVPFSSFGYSPLMGGKQSTLALTLDVAFR